MPRGENAKTGKQGFQRQDPRTQPGAAGVPAGAGAPQSDSPETVRSDLDQVVGNWDQHGRPVPEGGTRIKIAEIRPGDIISDQTTRQRVKVVNIRQGMGRFRGVVEDADGNHHRREYAHWGSVVRYGHTPDPGDPNSDEPRPV